MTTDMDALSELCATERGDEVPPPGAVDAGWQRLEATLWPGPEGGDGGDAPGGDGGGSAGPAAGSANAATAGLSAGTKIAAALALATAVGVAIATWPRDQAPQEPAVATSPATSAPVEPSHGGPALRAADPEPPQIATRDDEPRAVAPAPEDPPEDVPEDPPAAAEAPAGADRPTRALPDVPGEGLAHEVAILREASAALQSGKPAAALRWTRRHAADHPDGSLTEERQATEAIARCQLHDRRAAKVAAGFLESYPRSTHESRVRAACETMLSR